MARPRKFTKYKNNFKVFLQIKNCGNFKFENKILCKKIDKIYNLFKKNTIYFFQTKFLKFKKKILNFCR